MTQFLFFSGKGGVGKTTMACTTAVAEADAGTRVLIVTTDPASNLADVFEQPIGHAITRIVGVPSLSAMEIDPDRATAEYTDRTLAPIREIFPPEIVRVMEEQLAGPCTAEVAAFDRFADFLDPTAPAPAAPPTGAGFDLVIFDTAPTGHTVRLLELPEAWSKSISQADAGAGQTCIGPAAAIAEAKVKYERALAALRDQSLTRFAFVLHPEATAIAETRRAGAELARLGIVTTELIVNGILPAEEASTPFFAARIAMQERYLAEIARQLPMPTRRVPLLDGEVRGIARLRALVPLLADAHAARPAFGHADRGSTRETRDDGAAVAAALLPNGSPRTIFFAGKGGVGKTVASCATAVWSARQGHRTLLVTTDPAAHIGQVLGAHVGTEPEPVDGVDGLWAARVDAKTAAIAYADRIVADAVARGRSPASIAAMREELDSPCTEEMAAFDQFIELASRDAFDVTVFDTAPTGHTLRLLELPIDWSRQIDIKVFASVDTAAADDVAKAQFSRVIKMMRDPAESTFAFVMYPEATPIVEATRAIAELESLGIPLGLVVANMVLPDDALQTPYSRARWNMQQSYLADIEQRFSVPVLEVPLLDGEVMGLDRLTELLERTLAHTALVA